ncbi:sensor histidine kinase [Lactococcus lactis]|uniref:sensor histidine kinase n=1 Tax=Lactococcus lactis TaxID=1358 RepID=UPI0024A97F5F|nr:HAMP domain-containing sensor histidine kinase [Lactococcus lactis]
MKEIESKTSAKIITDTFVRIFLIFSLLITIIVSGIVAFTSLQIRKSEGAALLNSVQTAATNGQVNWDEFKLDSEKDEKATFVRLTSPSGQREESQGTTNFLKSRKSWGNFSLLRDDIFLYSSKTSKNGTKAELWLNINVVVKSMIRAILVIIAVMIFLFFLALILIQKAARTISQPLTDIVVATDGKDVKQVPVSKNPLEVHQLSQSFNRLLNRLNQKIENEQQFVSDASHELRTPVAAIRGHVNLLKRRWHEYPEIVDESLSYIDEESMRMKVLIENLLTISRGNHLEIKKERINLSKFTDKVVSEIQLALRQKINFDIQTDLFVSMDKMALYKIIIIFLENAGKYSPSNSEITINITLENHQVDFQVADEGIGVPEEEKDNIFERFYRIDKSRSSEIPGTGLGLAIAKEYAQLNDAKVFVSNNSPKGSTFHLLMESIEN